MSKNVSKLAFKTSRRQSFERDFEGAFVRSSRQISTRPSMVLARDDRWRCRIRRHDDPSTSSIDGGTVANETWRPRGYCYEALLRFPTLNVASDIRELRADAEGRVHGASERVRLKSHPSPAAARDRGDPGQRREQTRHSRPTTSQHTSGAGLWVYNTHPDDARSRPRREVNLSRLETESSTARRSRISANLRRLESTPPLSVRERYPSR